MIVHAGRLPSYLTTNGYSYCFRMRVPRDLNRCIGRMALKLSLPADIFWSAGAKALFRVDRYGQLFEWIVNKH